MEFKWSCNRDLVNMVHAPRIRCARLIADLMPCLCTEHPICNPLLRTSGGATRQRKDVERRAGPSVADIRIGGGARFYAGVWAQLAPDNRHILPTVWTGVTDWRPSEVTARAERPEDLPRAGIKRAEHTLIRTALKKQVSSGSHYRRVVADFPRHSPDRFARHRIGGLQFSGRLGSWSEWIGLAHVLTQG